MNLSGPGTSNSIPAHPQEGDLRMIRTHASRRQSAPLPWIAPVLLTAVFLATGLAGPVRGADSAEKILARCAKAMGGEKALKKISSWQAQGTVTRGDDSRAGSFGAAARAPGQFWREIRIGSDVHAEAFNGKSGWRTDPGAGLRTLTGDPGRDFQAEARFRCVGWLQWKKDKCRLASAGAAAWNGKPARKVLLTTRRDVRIALYFDPGSGLLLGEEFPAGNGLRRYEYSDYRPVQNLRLPFAVTVTDGRDTFRIALEAIRINALPAAGRFDFPVPEGRALPDIPALLQEVAGNQERLEKLLDHYAYTESHAIREFDKGGTMREKPDDTYEITFVRGRQVRRLVAREGQALSASDQAKEDRKLEKQVLQIEKEAAATRKGPDGKPAGRQRSVSIGAGLKTSRMSNPRWEQFAGRELVVFDFEPNLAYKPKDSAEKLMQKVAGTLWVDAADRQVVRFEAKLLESYKVGGGLLGSVKPGATIIAEQTRINNEIWLPSQIEVQLDARALFVGVSLNRIVRYSKYQRFGVESEEKINLPKE
jgi:hypothetical protein